MYLINVGERPSFIESLKTISDEDAIKTLRNLSNGDKQYQFYLWVMMAIKSNGHNFGVYRIGNLHNAKELIIQLANICNIDFNKEYEFYS